MKTPSPAAQAQHSPKYRETFTVDEVLIKYQELHAHAQRLAEALKFYMMICGNTAYQIGRDTAREMYDQGSKALKDWEAAQK